MKSNFNSSALLCNAKITIEYSDNEIYSMILPTLYDKIHNIDFDIFEGFCGTELTKLNETYGTNFKSKLDLLRLYQSQPKDKRMFSILKKYLDKYMIGFMIQEHELYWGRRLLKREVFDLFCTYMAIALGMKDIKELKYVITEDMDEVTKKQILLERKIADTKKKDVQASSPDLDIILAGVSYEFGYNFSQMLDLTLYAIYFMYSQIGKIMSYTIGNIACGNGLLKKNTKHNHWAN